MTLDRYKVLSSSQWQVVECRSASVPTSFSEIVQYAGVFELFAFLLVSIWRIFVIAIAITNSISFLAGYS